MKGHTTESTDAAQDKVVVENRRVSCVGLATIDASGTPLDIWFPVVRMDVSSHACESVEVSLDELVLELGDGVVALVGPDAVRNVKRVPMRVTSSLADAPRDLFDLYLRFHLLSHRLVTPRSVNLVGFLSLVNHSVAWTSRGPCAAAEVPDVRLRAAIEGHYLQVHSIFGVPPMTGHVALPDVRIIDTSRVLLGAYLAPGTVVTAAGFCGLNAGTLGACMVEGRISTGVVVGAGTHLGGGSSLMGSTSGGNRHMVTLGKRCLIGANGGTAISLGDDCVVEAGFYVTGGLPVTLDNGRVVKAEELAGRANLEFRRNARNGNAEAVRRVKAWGQLHPDMHRA
jgi:2,3,4,5-tetrahydropyridine-2-carboxylate N-succinyltransferase